MAVDYVTNYRLRLKSLLNLKLNLINSSVWSRSVNSNFSWMKFPGRKMIGAVQRTQSDSVRVMLSHFLESMGRRVYDLCPFLFRFEFTENVVVSVLVLVAVLLVVVDVDVVICLRFADGNRIVLLVGGQLTFGCANRCRCR